MERIYLSSSVLGQATGCQGAAFMSNNGAIADKPVLQTMSTIISALCRVGDAVFGQAAGCLGSAVLTCGQTLVPMPPNVTFAEASTIPTVFLTAHSCLHDEAGISQSSQLLVHAATGEMLTSASCMMRLICTIFCTSRISMRLWSCLHMLLALAFFILDIQDF